MRISRHRYKRRIVPERLRIRYNEAIRVPQMRVITTDGQHLGVMNREDALALAAEHEKDLVEINPAAQPPICKIMEYGQFKYQLEKQEKLRKNKQKEVELKGVRLSPRIGMHDLEVRKNQALSFLRKGSMVRIEIILHGRERGHADIAKQVVRDFISALQKVEGVRIEQPIAQQGPRITATIAPTQDTKKIKTGETLDE